MQPVPLDTLYVNMDSIVSFLICYLFYDYSHIELLGDNGVIILKYSANASYPILHYNFTSINMLLHHGLNMLIICGDHMF